MTSQFNRIQYERQLRISYSRKNAWEPLMGVFWQYGAWWEAPDTPEQNQAMSEMALYAIDYCTAMGLDVDEVMKDTPVDGVDYFMDVILGKLAQYHLGRQEVDVKKWLGLLLNELSLNAGGDVHFGNMLAEVWGCS